VRNRDQAQNDMTTIVQKDDNVLRGTASAIPPEQVTSEKIKKVISSMKEALAREEDGVAIAAPQIGESLRIFVISRRAFEIDKEGTDEKGGADYQDMVFINPEIINHSKETAWMEEGCLSVRWLYGKVRRFKKATVKALDEEGRPFTRGGSKLMAQIYQHEIDHLEGTLFIDKAKDVRENLPETTDKKDRYVNDLSDEI
jgi:peptide deformylase